MKQFDIKPKEDEVESNIEEDSWSDKLDLLKHTTEVHSSIKGKINSDFTLARLEQKDKEGVIELGSNSYYSIRIMDAMKNKGKKWKWDNGKWKRIGLTDEEKKKIDKYRDKIFDAFFTRIYLTVILNRNVKRNWLLRLISGFNDEKEEEKQEREDETVQNKIKKMFKKETTE